MKILYYIKISLRVFLCGVTTIEMVSAFNDKDTSDDCGNNGDRGGGGINSDSNCSKDDRCNSGCGDDNIDGGCDNNVNGGDGGHRW